MPCIHDYLDYRLFLRDSIQERKKRNPHFSYRYIAMKVGFRSPGLLTQILKGTTKMSPDLALRFAVFFKLNKRETEYLEILVQFNNARTHQQRAHLLRKLLYSHRPAPKEMAVDKYEFYDKWYYTAVRELLCFFDPGIDGVDIGRKLSPEISPAESRKAVELLLRLGLIKRTESGSCELTDRLITTGDSDRSVSITSFHLNMLRLGMEAFDRFERDQRSIATITCAISPQGKKAIEEKLQQLRAEIMGIINNDDAVDRVYQLNIQLFPLSKHD